VQEEVEQTAQEHGIDRDVAEEVEAVYRADDVPESGLPAEARRLAALRVLADREHEFYSEHFEGRTVSRAGAATLLMHAERLRDLARTDGVEGYRAAAARLVAFSRSFHLANALHRRFAIEAPLAHRLMGRFEVLLATRTVLQKLIRFDREQIGLLFGDDPSQELAALLDERLAGVERAIAALKLQYPVYARQLEVHFLARTAAQAEDEHYERLHDESIINRDVFDELARDLQRRRRLLERRPALDLGLDREDLIARVPMFATCDGNARRSVARLLRPRLALPGEAIVRKGERGDAMYFISSGAVEVRIETPVQLGTGDFFGELALLVSDRRTADVVALCYCQLLSLGARDLDQLFLTEPAIGQQIETVARARRAAALPAG